MKGSKTFITNAPFADWFVIYAKDGDAYLRYTMAKELNPNIRVRLFQAGAGTLWTNMGEKGMNLFMPLPSGEKADDGKQKAAKSGSEK